MIISFSMENDEKMSRFQKKMRGIMKVLCLNFWSNLPREVLHFLLEIATPTDV